MKNNSEYKNSHKSLSFNQILCWAEDPPSFLVDFCEKDKVARDGLRNFFGYKEIL